MGRGLAGPEAPIPPGAAGGGAHGPSASTFVGVHCLVGSAGVLAGHSTVGTGGSLENLAKGRAREEGEVETTSSEPEARAVSFIQGNVISDLMLI